MRAIAFHICLLWGSLVVHSPSVLARRREAGFCHRRDSLSETQIIGRLLANYTKTPPDDEGPVEVHVEMRVQQVSALNELTRDFETEVLFSQIWSDPALNFKNMTTCKNNITLESNVINEIWIPHTNLINSRSSAVHVSPYENTMFILYNDGKIWLNYRMQARSPCDLNLRAFPFDTQRCFMRFRSYYKSEQVQLGWLSDIPVAFGDRNQIDLPDFRLVGWSVKNVTEGRGSNGWDELVLTLIFRRRYGFFVLQAYVPTYLTIIVSWVSFSMNSEIKALPARSTVGVSCLLALTFQIGNIFANLPRVSYVKAMDVWMLGCITFVFGSIVELAVVCSINKYCRKRERFRNLKRSFRNRPNYRMFPMYLSPPGEDGDDERLSSSLASLGVRSSFLRGSPSPLLQPSGSHVITYGRRPRNLWFANGREHFRHIFLSRPRKCILNVFNSDRIDRVSMLAFPSGFTLFNVFYWWYYLSQAYTYERELIDNNNIILI